jgi:hypothetical protein
LGISRSAVDAAEICAEMAREDKPLRKAIFLAPVTLISLPDGAALLDLATNS